MNISLITSRLSPPPPSLRKKRLRCFLLHIAAEPVNTAFLQQLWQLSLDNVRIQRYLSCVRQESFHTHCVRSRENPYTLCMIKRSLFSTQYSKVKNQCDLFVFKNWLLPENQWFLKTTFLPIETDCTKLRILEIEWRERGQASVKSFWLFPRPSCSLVHTHYSLS